MTVTVAAVAMTVAAVAVTVAAVPKYKHAHHIDGKPNKGDY